MRRLVIGVVVGSLVSVGLVSIGVSTSSAKVGEDVEVDLAEAMNRAEADVADVTDPKASARRLVRAIFEAPDHRTATGPLAALLRRSGFPIIAVDGEVLALPDDAGFPDATVVIDMLPNVARALREGSAHRFEDVRELMVAMEMIDESVGWGEFAVVLGAYGKGGSPDFMASAGSAIRALGAERAELLDPFAPVERQWIDPVQLLLISAHFGYSYQPRLDRSDFGGSFGRSISGLRLPRTDQPSACTNAANSFKNLDNVAPEMKALFEGLKSFFDALGKFIEKDLDRLASQGKLQDWEQKGWKGFKKLKEASDPIAKAAKVVGALLLVNGTRATITGKTSTHYKHRAGDSSAHVKVTAEVTFDSGLDLSRDQVKCANVLTGADLPADGPLEGFNVEWDIDQERRLTTGGASGAHLLPLAGSTTARGALVGTTDSSGKARLELTPPVERYPEEGLETTAIPVVLAKITKDDPDFELGDLFAAVFGFDIKGLVTNIAFRKLMEVGTNALLPTARFPVAVTYHGDEPIVVKGRVDDYFALAYTINYLEVDLVSCNGRRGPFIGTGTYGGVRIEALGEEIRAKLGYFGASALPPYASGKTDQLTLPFPDPDNPPEWTLVEGDGGAIFTGTLLLRSSKNDWNKAIPIGGGALGSPIGTLEARVADIPNWLDRNLTFTAYRVKSDRRCTGEPPFFWD